MLAKDKVFPSHGPLPRRREQPEPSVGRNTPGRPPDFPPRTDDRNGMMLTCCGRPDGIRYYLRREQGMPRRGFIPKREVLPDPVHGTVVVTKLINQIMLDGKRGVAQQVCYQAFDMIKDKTGKEANEVFQQALNNVMPQLEVKARRVGGATYQVPVEIRPERRQTLALRWIVDFSRKRGEKTMAERLANELMEAANNGGNAVKRTEEMHRMAEANKAFAHYRW